MSPPATSTQRWTRWFRRIWRINALLILLSGLLVVAVLAFVLGELVSDALGSSRVGSVVNVEEEGVEQRLDFSHAEPLGDSGWQLLALRSRQEYVQGYLEKSAQATRNYGFLSPQGDLRWLYPHNRFLVAQVLQLPAAGVSGQPQEPRLLLFEVKQQDSNGDLRLSYRDASSIVLTSVDGSEQVELLHGVSELISQRLLDDRLTLTYTDEEGTWWVPVQLPALSLGQRRELVPPPDEEAP